MDRRWRWNAVLGGGGPARFAGSRFEPRGLTTSSLARATLADGSPAAGLHGRSRRRTPVAGHGSRRRRGMLRPIPQGTSVSSVPDAASSLTPPAKSRQRITWASARPMAGAGASASSGTLYVLRSRS